MNINEEPNGICNLFVHFIALKLISLLAKRYLANLSREQRLEMFAN